MKLLARAVLGVGLAAGLLSGCGGSAAVTGVTGTAAAGFTLPGSQGEQVSLSDYAGRPVLLYFHMALG